MCYSFSKQLAKVIFADFALVVVKSFVPMQRLSPLLLKSCTAARIEVVPNMVVTCRALALPVLNLSILS